MKIDLTTTWDRISKKLGITVEKQTIKLGEKEDPSAKTLYISNDAISLHIPRPGAGFPASAFGDTMTITNEGVYKPYYGKYADFHPIMEKPISDMRFNETLDFQREVKTAVEKYGAQIPSGFKKILRDMNRRVQNNDFVSHQNKQKLQRLAL